MHLLFQAADSRDRVLRAADRPRRTASCSLDDWVPRPMGPRGEAALAELARRYFAAYGPARRPTSPRGRACPLRGHRTGDGRDRAGDRGVSRPGAGACGRWSRSAAPAEVPRPPVVRLLGHFDTFLLGYRRREHHRRRGGGDVDPSTGAVAGSARWSRRTAGSWAVGASTRSPAHARGHRAAVRSTRPPGRTPRSAGRWRRSGSFLERPARWSVRTLGRLRLPPT